MIKVPDDHLSLSHIFGMLSRVFLVFPKNRRKENLIRVSVLWSREFRFPSFYFVRFVTIVSVSHMFNDAYEILAKVVVDLRHFSTLKSQ